MRLRGQRLRRIRYQVVAGACVRAGRLAVRRVIWVVPLLSLLALAGCAGAASSKSMATAAARTGADDCDRIAGNGRTFYESSPTYTDPRDDGADWSPTPPEKQGMDSTMLGTGLTKLGNNASLFSALVIRHDRLVAERYYHGSGAQRSNNVHSASKSILQALVHIAIAKGHIKSLDDPVADYLPEYSGNASPDKKKVTIRHMLTMTSGLDWTEDSTESQVEKASNWVQAILGRSLVSVPGTTYNYSTGNTHVVSAVLHKATGMSTCQFAHRYLFGPMGITAEHWGRDPRGIFSGGYNLYLTPREMAKFGLLYLHDGRWAGQPLVPHSAVRAAQTKTTQIDDTFAYSEGWWMHTISGRSMYFAWGHGGQFIYVIPSADIVLVTSENTSNNSINKEINPRAFIRDYLLPATTGP
jgi:CubicO group peptidase (beta-lactamase class C family)